MKPPTLRTLQKYGLNQEGWLAILKRQGGKCAICRKGEDGTLWNIDHEHAPGWTNMSDEDRARHVRGILCFHCNKYKAPSRMTKDEAQRLSRYISNYERRRDAT